MHLPNVNKENGLIIGDNKAKINKPSSTDYWRQRLASVTPTIFPLRSSPSPITGYSSVFRLFPVAHEILTRDHGISVSTLATLAYALALSAHSASEEEVAFGYVYCKSSIDTPGTEDSASPRSITLPYNAAFEWDQTTLDFLRNLQSDIFRINDYAQVSLREIFTSNSAPLFRTILNCCPLLTSAGLLNAQTPETSDANYDLAFFLRVTNAESVEVETQFAPASISEPEVKAFQEHFGAALDSILQNLENPLRDVVLVSSEEKQRLIYTNNPASSLGPALSSPNNVTELIEEQAHKTPQKIALQFSQEMFVTYREMDMFANNLAHTLLADGVQRGDLVGIYMEKSCEMFIAILAIHKSGGGYVPLDPTHPAERIQTILSLAGVKVALTSKKLRNEFGTLILGSGALSLVVDIHELTPTTKPDVHVGRDDISHVLFTSGSTGRPKGVILAHGSIIESLIGAHAVIGNRDDRVLQFSDYTFDVSVWDWSITLSDGGTLCILPKRELMNDLGAVANSMDITFLETTPTVLALIKPQEVPSLKMFAVGGELLTPEVCAIWAPAISLINVYGPTETSTNVLARTGVTSSTEGSNIGWPFGLNVAYVLDKRMRPVPLGCVGELFISGPQVARGYLNNPEQTAKVFVDDPFRPGSTMYATGDLARINPADGSFSYLGRRDTQIKIRGLRVETGEIETLLKATSNLVTNAVVLKINVGNDMLVAFIECAPDLPGSSTEPTIIRDETASSMLVTLRSAVRTKLPSYMAPGNYVVLDKFPLASSGKLDRRALANFFHVHEQVIREHRTDSERLAELYSSEPRTAPINDRQTMLRSLWASILKVNKDSLGIDDDFYAMGGDSISAIRLANLAREASLPLLATDIIENPTIRALAHIAESSVVNNDFDHDDAPTVTLEHMTPNDLTLMQLDQKHLDKLRNHVLPEHGLLPSDVLDIYPCTALQTSLLMAGLVIDGAYVVRQAYDLPFGTTSSRIRQAFEDFINHPNGAFLRTVFVFDTLTNRYLQAVMRPDWRQMEWTTVTVTNEVELQTAISEYQDGRGGMKFERGELHTRACLFELNGTPRVLIWSSHHAMADHWTMNNAESDIDDVYAGRPLHSRRSFKPMIKYLEHLDRTAGLEFWRLHLLNVIPTTFLQAAPGSARTIVNESVSRKVYTDYSLLTKQFGIMPSSLVTAAWSIVLSAHTGSLDIVFGQIMSGRNVPIKDIDSMAGNTLNTVARRVILRPESSVLHTLLGIQSEQIEISKHEHIALADLLSQGIPVSSLFRSLLNFTNLPGDQKHPPGTVGDANDHFLWNHRPGGLDGQDFPFAFSVIPLSTDGFSLEVSYTKEVISELEVATILDHFETVLHSLIRKPHAPIQDVELISPCEMQRLTRTVDTKPLLNPAECIWELVEAQIRRTPEKIALQFTQETFLTYRKMEAFVNALASILITKGVKRGDLVGLYMDKSVEMFLSIFATHRAGGAFVPLDPENPPERIRNILDLAEGKIVLTSYELQQSFEKATSGSNITALVVDVHDLYPATKLDVEPISRKDVSHVLFTSGSTGTPKGIVTGHGAVIESVISSREVFGPRHDRVLQFSNYTFDFSVWDWAATLSAGGTLCIAPKRQLMDNLAGVMHEFNVTFLETTPTVISLINPDEVPTLQTLTAGGEQITAEVRSTWADEVILVNVYGPTETTVAISAQKHVTLKTELDDLGHPIGLNNVYVLDERRRPVPLGCVGELYVSGPQVAFGYLKSPEQTAKAFMDNPFHPGTVIYATGDLARMSPVDGSLTYLGRRDTQIKIHGLRVEIGEIEEVLRATSKIITNAAVVKVDVDHEHLVAFLEYPTNAENQTLDIKLVCDDRLGPLVATLRHAVRQRLPAYMAPTIYVAVNQFPRSSSGKLDRKALNSYFYSQQTVIQALTLYADGATAAEHGVDAASMTRLQSTVRSLWASVLHIREGLLRIDDDFYTVGGDSISAIRLASAAREAGLHLPATDIIRNPTIRAMAKIAESAIIDREFDDDDVPSVSFDQMCPRDLTLLDLDQAQLNFLRDSLFPQHDVYPSTGLQTPLLMAGLAVEDAYIVSQAWDLPPGTTTTRLKQAFEDFIDHPNGMMLRTIFVLEPTSNRFLQVVVRPGAQRMEWMTVFITDETELDMRVEEYQRGRAIQPFEEGTLLSRACVFELDGCPRALVWSVHHALVDHRAMDNVMSDIQDAYAGRSLRARRPFKPMVKYLERLDRTPGLEFWRNHLQNASPTPFLQAIIRAPRMTTNATVTRAVHTEHSSFARRFGIMPSTLATAAWAIVLEAHTNCNDVVFGQVLAGQSTGTSAPVFTCALTYVPDAPIRDIASITGITINTVARRVTHNADANVLEYLRHIQSDQIEISKHEHITLEDLHSEGISVSELFRTILNFRNAGTSHAATDIPSHHKSRLFGNLRDGGRDGVDFPFVLSVDVSSVNDLFLSVAHVTEIIPKADIDVILDHFETALLFFINHPNAKMCDVRLISASEEHRLLFARNPPHPVHALLSSAQNISELIEWQVQKTPQRIALQFDQDVFLTYEQMDSLSNDLVRKLITSGVKRGTLVALYMDKSVEMYLSILAVHKTGGGFVALDPEHPSERIQTILGLAQVSMVLTIRELQGQLLPALGDTRACTVLVDFTELSPAAKPDVGPVGRDDICYVLFTSGSTGTPKGVVVTHGSVIESTLASRELVGLLDGRVLQFSNYTFDFSVWDWGSTLISGGTLCVVPKRRLMDDLGNIAHSLDVTYLEASPTVVSLITPDEIPSLQKLTVGGELLPPAVRDTWAGAVFFTNVYGPTETGVAVIARRVTPSTVCSNLGWRFGLNSVYILDERQRPVPLGCVGELFISGPQLAHGYLNNPEATAKAFVFDPFRHGSRMYATGDMARMNPQDESITFVDRRDTQIKIRGLRVEAGEIEMVLKSTSKVITNAVVVKVNVGHEALLAFLECRSDTMTSDIVMMVRDDNINSLLESLKHAVRQKLPSYMEPTMYVVLDKFPLTSSGKLHRNALLDFFQTHKEEIRIHDIDTFTGHIESTALPQTELQALLRFLWASVLHVNEGSLSVDANFYMAGGDSILAIRLATAARQAGLSLLPTDIFRNPTIRAMSLIAAVPSVFDDFIDDAPSHPLDRMSPTDLTLLNLDEESLDFLRNDLLPRHDLSPWCAPMLTYSAFRSKQRLFSDVIDIYPSTYLQTNFLLAGLIVDHAYINKHTYDLPCGTDSARLRQAFEDFLNHANGAMFRTVFVFDPLSNTYLQVLIKPGAKRVEWKTVIVADETELQVAINEYQRDSDSRPFGPGSLLTRACVFELDGSARALVWVIHHALQDGWTQHGHISDIQDTYTGRSLSTRRPFKHMVRYLEGLDRARGLEFWKHKLETALPTPFLQPIPGAPRTLTNATATREIRIGHTSMAREFGIIASTLATAAWAFVLSAHSGSSDVVFGQVLAGRSAPISDIDSMIGTCINTVARRVILDPGASVIDTLRSIQGDQIDIIKHEYITLAEIQAEGIPVSGLFRSLLNILNLPADKLQHNNSSRHRLLNSRVGGNDSLDLPLCFNVSFNSTDGFVIKASYEHDTISATEVEVLLDHYETALHFIVREPHALVEDINLISASENRRLLFEHNAAYPLDALLSPARNISELIRWQVQKTPQRIALQFDQDVFLTYERMHSLSNDLARKLVTGGVKRGMMVALYMDKSVEMYLSILAVHKAGGGFVALDPEHPPERIQTILGLAQAPMVLTTRELQGQLLSALKDTCVSAMLVDFKELSPAEEPDIGPVDREDICYIVFTSGSTGTPKGVVVTHGSVVESTIASQEAVGPLNGRVLQFSNYTFDFSVWDWGATLIYGGTLCVVSKRKLMDDLGNAVHSLDVTYLETSPTVISLIRPEEVPSLQKVAIGGEPLSPVVRDTWATSVSFVSVYGPTEACVIVLARKGVDSTTSCSSLGWCFGLNSVYILDERRRPVPLGCVGELFISGPQLARGYLNNPEETVNAFMSNPFRPGSLMYATGDLVRMSPEDESITFVDRRDTQIKIRGLRVEAGEIEAVLQATSKAITNAAVIKVNVGRENLVAFLECPSDAAIQDLTIVRDSRLGSLVEELRNVVRQKLPSYMAPTIYVPVHRFPLSSSGKLDRKALKSYFYSHQKLIQEMSRRLDSITPTEQNIDAAHLNELQATLRSLWASELRINENLLRIDDDFYIVGGDSISAIRLASAAREAGLHLPATDIIRNPTIRAMAKIAESAIIDREFDDDDVPSVSFDQMCPRDLTLLDLDQAQLNFLRDSLFPQHGLSASDIIDVYPSTGLQTPLLMAGLAVEDAYIVSQAWDLPPGTTTTRLKQAFEDFIDHPNGMMLRTIFVLEPTSNRFLQVVVRPGAQRMEWMTVFITDETELDMRVEEYQRGRAIQPFEEGTLLSRACVFELDGCPRALVWSVHHALVDHRAMDNVMSDIQDAYAGRSLRARRPFKPMVKYLERLDRTPGLEFWRNHLQNASPTPFLHAIVGAHRMTANATVVRAVHTVHSSFTRKFGIMPSTLVTSAWAIVLAAHSNCNDVVFGQVLAGQNAPIRDVVSMTGITINTVPRRVTQNPDATVLETLRHIQSEQIEISKHEHITLADLHSEGIPVSGLFKTILNFRNLASSEASGKALPSDAGGLFGMIRNGRDGLDFPFALSVDVSSTEDILLSVAYVAEIVPEAEVNVILNHFETALQFLMHNPNVNICDVELTSIVEKQQLLCGRNPPYPLDAFLSPAQNISDLIEWQVRKTPQRIALQLEQEVFLTYQQMDFLSNDLAHKLIQHGVKRGTLVALYMEKSIEMFLSILAVHKAGGGYVPLDPEYPDERIQTIVRAAEVAVVLTISGLHKQLCSALVSSGIYVVLVDFTKLSPAAKPTIDPVGRQDICYVLFTSGSTGKPKGVVLTHQSIVESTLGSKEVIGPLNGRVLQFSNYTFDVSVWDWAATLSAGGTLCIVPKRRLMDELGNVARSLDITYLGTSPTVAALISPQEIPSLQTLELSGETPTLPVRDAWADAVSLVNAYGPTEAGIHVIALKGVTSWTVCSNIGWPFGLNSAYILDERLRLVPLGCIGGLFIGGPQVARGYLHNPEETARSFLPDPFRPGSFMYATGDLVRMSPQDHSITFLGRRDTQLKIRGLRVEAGEIEAVLQATTNVITNAAVIKVDVDFKALIAFIECRSDTPTSDIVIMRDDSVASLLASLKQAARRKLPSYMVPAMYVVLDRFPLTASGKLDRNALATLFHRHESVIRDFERQLQSLANAARSTKVKRTRFQTRIMKLWQTVLGIEEDIDIDDTFTLMGGDSVKLMRLSALAFKEGIPLPVTEQLQRQTIRTQAQLLLRN
ncbi:amino acid adenylation [Ramaria rubella]|nr:amino acid adenylation [Ramaria rubella]